MRGRAEGTWLKVLRGGGVVVGVWRVCGAEGEGEEGEGGRGGERGRRGGDDEAGGHASAYT